VRSIKGLLGIALVAVLAVAAAGCGGDDNGSGDGDRLTKTEYAAKANAICADFKKELDALPAPQGFEEAADYAEKAKPIFDEHLDQLKDLDPPEDLQDVHDKWIATGDKARERLDELEQAAEDKDAKKLAEIGREAAAEDKVSDAYARQLGATTCATI
jgi:hypothetical protein